MVKDLINPAKYWDVQAECIPIPELRTLQKIKLNKTLQYVQNKSPFYKRKYAGGRFKKIKSLADIRQLPFTSKEEIINSDMFDLVAVTHSDLREVHLSSGTTNRPSPSFLSATDLKTSTKFLARTWYMQGIRPQTTFGMLASYGMFSAGLLNHYAIQNIGAFIVPISNTPTAKLIEYLTTFRVDSTAAIASYYLYLIHKLSSSGLDPATLKLKQVIAGGEPFTENQRKYIEDHLKAKMYDQYGLCEINTGIAGECKFQNGLHLLADYVYPEIVNPDTLENCAEGELGELVLTTLEKYATPLIRYRTGDLTSINYETCQCGRTMPRLSRFKGRIHPTIFYKGVKIDLDQIEAFMEKQNAFIDPYLWQLHLVGSMSDQKIILKIIPSTGRNKENSILLIKGFKKRFGLQISIEIFNEQEIRALKGGKIKRLKDFRKEI